MKLLNYIGVILLFFCFSSFAQPSPGKDITGKVINERSESLANANVTIKNGRGTVTNARGQFLLKNVAPNDILQISFVGYSSQTVAVKDQSIFNIVLKQAENELDKVVVQGYGTTSKRLSTGNIGKITSEDIGRQPVMNPIEALKGQMAGVVVTNVSGFASGTLKIEVRGRNTINPNVPSDPLYIVDGVPITILDLQGNDNYLYGSQGVIQTGILSPAKGQSPFFSINPSDIESIEVLKDADATAIYGSRASNGVVLITTKKGRAGKTKFEININTGVSETPRYYNMLNTRQYILMRKEALLNGGLAPDINNAPDLTLWDTTRYTNWQKYLWGGIGKVTDAQIGLAGGNPRTTFRITSGYRIQKEILTASGANKRFSTALNLNHKTLNQKFDIGFSGSYSVVSSDMIFIPGAINLPPNAPSVFDDNGNLNFAGWAPLDYSYPFSNLKQPYSFSTKFLNSSLTTGLEIVKGLKLKANIGYNNIQTEQSYIIPISSQNPAYNPKGSTSIGYSFINNLIIEPQVEYETFVGKGKLSSMIGGSFQINKTSSASLYGEGFTNDVLLTSVTNAPVRSASNSEGEYKYGAVFARFNYTLKNKYILNANFRRDGSSKFGPGRQFGNFGSIGAAWLVSEENWLKQNLKFLSTGKLKVSYGSIGGDQIADYQYLSRWAYQRYTYNNILPLNPIGHNDSLLHWEVNKKLEINLLLGFINDKITFDVSWYRNRCNNQLVPFPTPILTGFPIVVSNSPANVQNTGLEFVLNGKIIENKTFTWSTKFNIGINRNKLLSYPNFEQSPYVSMYVIGKSLNTRKSLHYLGVDPQTGLYMFEDKNKDGQITIDNSGRIPDDQYPYDLSPKYDGGFTNTIKFKNWEFSIFFYFKKQIGLNAISALNAPGDNSNQPISVLKRWQKPNDITDISFFTTNPYANNSFINYQLFSDAAYTNASFIRLQNLSLAYFFPGKNLKKLKLSNFKIYLQGNNLFIISKYNGLDPEIQNFTVIPLPRIITAGISCNF
ncbi:SusC/RagA family TonB-linked outer membrane protein [Agriterribacter humi]|uniref:SusC/RagA family TonB-linked outer membrane protein n=1 Tax=Agriterribacter humi TaxID=1104781 RepID=UPI0012648E89|nr:SusC/RagA family TonB-linked outer membrane protein [Agriterribacter humi]